MNIRKCIVVIMLSGFLVSSAACGAQTGHEIDTGTLSSDSESIAVTESVLSPNIPDSLDYDGAAISLYSNNYNDYCMSLVEGQNGEILNDARYQVQQNTEDLLNVKLAETGYNSNDLVNAVNNSVNAGDKGCDIACNLARFSVELMTKGIACDMMKYEYLDFDKEYWKPNINSSVSVGDSVYYAATGFNLAMYAYDSCFLFNSNLADALSVTSKSLYENVRNQTWTYEKMKEYMAVATGDLDGNGTMDENDRWGLTAYDWNTFASSVYTSGNTLTVSKSPDEWLKLSWGEERFYNAVETAYNMFHSSDSYIKNERNDALLFSNGKALFLNGFFYTLNSLSEMADDFGILPSPKYDEKQEDYINLTTDSIFAVIPFCAADPERSAAVLEVMSFYGHEYITPAYTETTLQYKKTRDTESAEMIRLCLDTARMDLGTIYGSEYCGWDAIYNKVMLNANEFVLSSYIASQDSAVNVRLQKVIEAANALN